jgi:PPOX class probable F420-dependent enzyme
LTGWRNHTQLTDRPLTEDEETAFPPEHRAFFENDNLAAISTLGNDGGPRVTMVWVDVDGDDILVNSTRSRRWPRNLERDPRVALCAFEKANVFNNVAVVGHVVSITTEGGWEHIQKLARKYGLEGYQGPSDRLVIRIAVEKSYLYRSAPAAGSAPPRG